ncbi:MAG: hypothetical protein ACK4NC_02345 [Candidatus Gracilibacteria bacterium]
MHLGENKEVPFVEEELSMKNILSDSDTIVSIKIHKIKHDIANELSERAVIDTTSWPFTHEQTLELRTYVEQLFLYVKKFNLLSEEKVFELRYRFQFIEDYRDWKVVKCELQSPVITHLELSKKHKKRSYKNGGKHTDTIDQEIKDELGIR